MLRSVARLAGAGAVAAATLLCTADGARSAAALDACALVTDDEAIAVIGSSDADLAGPLVVRASTCSWHSSQAGCTLRALSIELTTGDASRSLRDARAAHKVWSGAEGLGDDAFFAADELPPGAAVFIEHLHLRRDDVMARITLVGRIGPDVSHELLGRVGGAVAARLDQSS